MLNDSERVFLKDIGYEESDVFDSRFVDSKTAKTNAKAQGKDLMLGAKCQKAGHRLRTRHGHCVQCDTSKLAHFTRYKKEGFIYIARSKAKRLIKVGVCDDLDRRVVTLSGYANADDWEMCLHFWSKNSGRIEHNIQSELSDYSVQEPYMKQGKKQVAKEVFKCDFTRVYQALNKTLGQMQVKPEKAWMLYPNPSDYD